MKLLHFADSHLGFRQFSRQAENGINQREIDVATTFARAVEQMIMHRPDIIVIGGDVFHQSHPTNNAILHANASFRRLRQGLPHIPIIMVSGNHDAPRTADSGCILPLFRDHNITVVQNHVEEFEIPELDLYVMAVPDVIGIERGGLQPRKYAKHRVLLMHGEIAGMIAVSTPQEIPVEDLHADTWSYIALGHYHVYRQVAPNAFYSGSLDYTSTNPWGELIEQDERHVPGKGFIVHDLSTGTHRFQPVGPSRAFEQIATIDCADLKSEDIDTQIRIAVETRPHFDNGVMRVVLTNCPRHRLRELDQKAIREYRLRALHFQIDCRKPEAQTPTLDLAPSDRRMSLNHTARVFFETCDISPDVNRNAFVTDAMEYLRRADDSLAPVTLHQEAA
ncbi:MAG: metallophosphoesterase family protein [Gemmatimonas sp.]